MRERLEGYNDLIDNDQYLPMFRNRQINHPELFEFSAALARKKDNPAKYFSAIWGRKSLLKTIDWIQKLINLAKSKAAEAVRAAKKVAETVRESKELNREGRRRLEKMKKKILQQAGSRPIRA